jgi:hypothetical protein
VAKTKDKYDLFLTYILDKINMLVYDFKLKLQRSDIEHFLQLESEVGVDNFARDLLKKGLPE